jgi:hypothetical protein
MLLTLNAQRMPARPNRRISLRLVAVFAAICAGTGAALLLRPTSASHITTANVQPVWAGAISAPVSDPVTQPLRETSASYTSPVAIQAASDSAVRTPPARVARNPVPPRRPAEPSVVAAPASSVVGPALPVSATVDAAPTAKPKTIFSASGLMERLPSRNMLLTPFTKVGDTMSGLIKHF